MSGRSFRTGRRSFLGCPRKSARPGSPAAVSACFGGAAGLLGERPVAGGAAPGALALGAEGAAAVLQPLQVAQLLPDEPLPLSEEEPGDSGELIEEDLAAGAQQPVGLIPLASFNQLPELRQQLPPGLGPGRFQARHI